MKQYLCNYEHVFLQQIILADQYVKTDFTLTFFFIEYRLAFIDEIIFLLTEEDPFFFFCCCNVDITYSSYPILFVSRPL